MLRVGTQYVQQSKHPQACKDPVDIEVHSLQMHAKVGSVPGQVTGLYMQTDNMHDSIQAHWLHECF